MKLFLWFLTAALTLAYVATAQAQSTYEPYSFTTLAGGTVGSADGTGAAAQFRFPGGVAVDTSGNVYVADTFNDTIRKIASGAVVTTFAGSAGSPGSTDGTGSAARFDMPQNLAVDSAGNVFVADTSNDTIRKITPAGVVTTVAGLAGSSGSTDGAGAAARFSQPAAITVDSSGNLYVADTNNSTIRKIAPGGIVTTLAGSAGLPGSADGAGAAARFNRPLGVAVDSAGNVFVADSTNSTIRQITPGGVVTTVAGLAGSAGSVDGTGSAARFNAPVGIAVDAADNLFVGETNNELIRKITPAGVVTTLAGSTGAAGNVDGVGSSVRFNGPEGVAVDSSGRVFVADNVNNSIRQGQATATLANISTRAFVGTGNNVLIGGFIVTGSVPKKVLVRAIGPSLAAQHVSGPLMDPMITLRNTTSQIASNDNWQTDPNASQIPPNLQPTDARESAIFTTLNPDSYTAIVSGVGATTGAALVEAYDMEPGSSSELINISTRGFVQTGDFVMIGGFVPNGLGNIRVFIRARGPSLTQAGINNPLPNPTIKVFDGNGMQIGSNDNWKDTQQADIQATGLAPTNDLESGIILTLAPGGNGYTAIVSDKNGASGIGTVEVFKLQ